MRRLLRILLVSLCAVGSVAASSGDAFAKGCIKGAIVGGVIGHYAGHHGALGAVAGCLYGRHRAHEQQTSRSRQREDYYGQQRLRQPAPPTPAETPNDYNSI